MSPLFSNRQSRAGTLVTASMCTAIAVVFSVIGLYIPVFSTLVFLIVPIPIAYMCLMGNMKWGVAVCVAVLLLDSLLFGVMSGAFASSVFCLLGLTLGYGYRKKYSAATILALGTLVSAAVFGAQVFFASAFMGFDPSLFAGKVTPDMQQQMDSMLSAVYSGKELEAARAQSGPMLEMVIRAIPFSLFLVSLFEAWAPMLLCRIIFRRLGINAIKRINEGSFGNLRTKIYEMKLGTDESKPVMAERTRIANALVTERQGNAIELYIFDNGRGCPVISENNGLRGIRERTEALGGTVKFSSVEGEGFTTVIKIPKQTSAAAE